MSLNSFPQELIDEIITQLRYCHPRLTIGTTKYDLRNASLVSKKWVRESQRLLYEETYLSGWKLDLRGRDTPKSAVDIHHLVLWFGDQLTPAPLKVIEDFIPRLKSFENVRTLTLDMIDTTRLSQPNVAVHFPDGLTSLCLRDSLLEISTFTALFSSLPALLEFHAQGVTLTGPKVFPTKPISESLRVLDVRPIEPFRMIASRDMVLPLFAAHPLAYQELHFVGGCTVEHILPLISASAKTLERLSLPTLIEADNLHGGCLSECRKLRELSFSLHTSDIVDSAAVAILTSAPPPALSIINVRLRPPRDPYNYFTLDKYQMEVLDNALCECAQALGARKLEVSFDRGVGEPVEHHLHKFRELGIVIDLLM